MDDDNFYDLTLTKDGKLLFKEWKYDHELEKGEYIISDVTEDPFKYFGKVVRVEYGFTLDHLCSLISKDHEIFNIVLENCFISPFIDEYNKIKSGDYVAPEHTYDPDGIEYINLYWHAEVDEEYVWGLDRADCDGEGWKLREEKIEDWGSYPVGHRINWGLDFSPMEKLLHLPIVANEEMKVFDGDDMERKKPLLSCKKKYTLKSLIEGIFWEISFYGGPQNKAEVKEEVLRRKEEVDAAIESGDMSKFQSFDSLIKRVDSVLCSTGEKCTCNPEDRCKLP